ncbi:MULTISPECIES: LacI family DNA-binding transcriptional regulator [unclassified Microbacterium]|uniref:LacI family DNA-binding transcriptional regulator n=1 Tax=unclassified Microbacterium TaxID=2609290 RepID=UPI00214B4779|nr:MULTISPECIES: LacI family DNA-binding transcriptional regulator [unclassified Microbacterium]MCR2783468.1 LacI family transcriptional regulator [Microbacterium sp. zg.B96]WIM15668.1 LacI family DNA-binding transcriptional regulator [Microbacterium sp. zg-B96]
MAKSPGKSTITDVARHAGVSLSTVSRVMNGNATVDADLAERVRSAAVALGYTASPLARSLVLGRTQTIAVVVPDLTNPTFQAILRGLSRSAAADGYHVLIADSAEQVDEERVLATETRRRTDGVVLCAPRMSDEDLSALLPALSPAVVVNRPPQDGSPVVAADYRTAFGELIEHLYGLGHRRLAYLAGLARSASNAERLAAIADARAAHPDLQIAELRGGVDFASGAAAAGEVLASGATGVLAFNDLVAMGVLSALAERGIGVPHDISVTGFDDIPFAQYTTPPLTTAAVPSAELGARAWTALHAQLTGGQADAAVSLTPRLIARASTGPAAAAPTAG